MSEEYTHKECPFCAEDIKINAKKCHFCGETIDVALRAAEEAKREAHAANKRQNVYMNSSSSSSSSSGNAWYNPDVGGFCGCLILLIFLCFLFPCCGGYLAL